MHIEPGVVAPAKVMLANGAALLLIAYYAKDLIRRPQNILRTVIAALFFTLFMQSFHLSVGPSELHFVGAMVMYLTLGFIPTLLGFAAGLLLQATLFDPQDVLHLGVNSLTLILPLTIAHTTLGHKVRNSHHALRWADIVKLDAIYYTGVTAMVGFWLVIGGVETPFTAWITFATSYGVIVAIEPAISIACVRLLKRFESNAFIQSAFSVNSMHLADNNAG